MSDGRWGNALVKHEMYRDGRKYAGNRAAPFQADSRIGQRWFPSVQKQEQSGGAAGRDAEDALCLAAGDGRGLTMNEQSFHGPGHTSPVS